MQSRHVFLLFALRFLSFSIIGYIAAKENVYNEIAERNKHLLLGHEKVLEPYHRLSC